jgi:hypothetical protein
MHYPQRKRDRTMSIDQKQKSDDGAPKQLHKLPGKWPITLTLVLVLILGSLSWSIGGALTAPGTDTVAARLAEWGRDHGLGFAVTAAENLQYKLHPPKVGGKPGTALLKDLSPATTPPTVTPTVPAQVQVHVPLVPLVSTPLSGEGIFRTKVTVQGQPAVQVAYLRPDSSHTSYLAGVVWMSGALLRVEQHPGFAEPGHLTLWSQPDMLPPAARTGLVATFNSGFKIKDARGGYYADGHTVGKLISGAASIVIYKDGHADIATWGGALKLGPDIVSVRQNLALLVDHGQLSPNLDKNVLSKWGWTLKNAHYVWRSGVGVTNTGDLVFVAGDALSVQSLAELLQRAGAERAMELDINSEWISYMWYTPGATPTSPVPIKLLPFARPADRYFKPASRDFFAVYVR